MPDEKKQKKLRVFSLGQDKLNFEFEYNPAETATLKELLAENPTPTVEDLRRVALWKIDRVLEIPDETMRQLGAIAIEKPLSHRSEQSRSVLEALVACPGIGYPMASAILKFLRPDVFPIIDVRAYRALKGRKLASSSYSVEIYMDYVDELLKIAVKKNRLLRDIDEQLYCFDRKYNGIINS